MSDKIRSTIIKVTEELNASPDLQSLDLALSRLSALAESRRVDIFGSVRPWVTLLRHDLVEDIYLYRLDVRAGRG